MLDTTTATTTTTTTTTTTPTTCELEDTYLSGYPDGVRMAFASVLDAHTQCNQGISTAFCTID